MTSGRGLLAPRGACRKTWRWPSGVSMVSVWSPGVGAGQGAGVGCGASWTAFAPGCQATNAMSARVAMRMRGRPRAGERSRGNRPREDQVAAEHEGEDSHRSHRRPAPSAFSSSAPAAAAARLRKNCQVRQSRHTARVRGWVRGPRGQPWARPIEAHVLDARRGAAVAPGDLGHAGRELQPVGRSRGSRRCAATAPTTASRWPCSRAACRRRGRPGRRCRGSRAPAAGARACTARSVR